MGNELVPASSAALDIDGPRTGLEVAALGDALYRRLFVLALGGLQLACALTVLAALVRTEHAQFVRTTALCVGLAALAALALRETERCHRALRRRPALALIPSVLALSALVLDGVSHSPLSFVAAVSIALPAFLCGWRWALAAATVIAVGALIAGALHIGADALNSIGQGAAGYFIWAIVLPGLAESFARLAMQMPHHVPTPTTPPLPLPVPNLAGDTRPSPRTVSPTNAPADPRPAHTDPKLPLTARQLQVVALLADGFRAKDIADQLGISTSVVYKHVDQAKQRAGVNSRYELVALIASLGLIAQPEAAATTSHTSPATP